jgi:hypothetical protein
MLQIGFRGVRPAHPLSPKGEGLRLHDEPSELKRILGGLDNVNYRVIIRGALSAWIPFPSIKPRERDLDDIRFLKRIVWVHGKL